VNKLIVGLLYPLKNTLSIPVIFNQSPLNVETYSEGLSSLRMFNRCLQIGYQPYLEIFN
jgi:hypothetical protein